MTEAATTGNKSIINPKYRDRYKTPDWLGEQIAAAASASHTVETVVKDKDGKPTGEKTSKEVVDGVDKEKLFALARENGIDPTPYDAMNAGQQRMNVGNRLRSLTIKRHGLTVNGEWVDADAAWLEAKGAPEKPTHDHDGNVINTTDGKVKAKAEAKVEEPAKVDPPATEPAKPAKAKGKAKK